jgi:hypothetical protein
MTPSDGQVSVNAAAASSAQGEIIRLWRLGCQMRLSCVDDLYQDPGV